MTSESIYQLATEQRLQENRFRNLRSLATTCGTEISPDGKRALVNFASNDYLGLTQHKELAKRAKEYIDRFGVGLGASRLVSGNLHAYEHIEKKIAEFKGMEAALLLPTGYQTNVTVLSALGRKQTTLLCDKANHNSLTVGMQLTQGTWHRFKHNDIDHLKQKLEAETSTGPNSTWIVTESVFSMDGDRCDIDSVNALATKYDASIYLDEAHATGVLGPQGRGLAFGQKAVSVSMGTFSKAFGAFGAYVACSRAMKTYLVNFCGGLIYSTALPPAALGAIDAGLDIIYELESERAQLLALSESMRTKLQQLGYATGGSSTQIIPIIVGDDGAALSLSRHLEENGIFAPAIRPPTVGTGAARVRISLTAKHTSEHIELLFTALRTWKGHGSING